MWRLALLVQLCSMVGCADPALGDPCNADADCADVHRDAVCWDDGTSMFCTIHCDVEMTRCVRLEGMTCVETETEYRPDAFAAMTCDALGGMCELTSTRTVCR